MLSESSAVIGKLVLSGWRANPDDDLPSDRMLAGPMLTNAGGTEPGRQTRMPFALASLNRLAAALQKSASGSGAKAAKTGAAPL